MSVLASRFPIALLCRRQFSAVIRPWTPLAEAPSGPPHLSSLTPTLVPTTTTTTLELFPRTAAALVWSNVLLSLSVWFVKRTFQPSIIRKKRKTGFLVRQRTVGGRRVLKRRPAKGRWRLGGGI